MRIWLLGPCRAPFSNLHMLNKWRVYSHHAIRALVLRVDSLPRPVLHVPCSTPVLDQHQDALAFESAYPDWHLSSNFDREQGGFANTDA